MARGAGCARYVSESWGGLGHCLTGFGAGLPVPRSRHLQTTAARLRSEVCIRMSEGQGCPQRTSADGVWAIPTFQLGLHPPRTLGRF